MITQKEFKSTRFGWFLCGLAALFYCYEYLLRIAPSVMSTELMQYYSLNATAFGNLFAVYYFIYTPMQIPVGLMLDRFGARFLLTFATLICAMGTLFFATSTSLEVAIIGRLMVGFGSAFAFVGVLKVASTWLPPKRFGMIAGLATTLGMIGAMFGDNIMTALVEEFGWQATVFGSAFFGFILAGVLWYYIRNQQPAGTSTKEVHPIVPVLTLKKLFLHLLLLLKKPQIWLIAAIGGILYTSLSVFAELWGVPYLKQAKGYSSQEAAALISLVFLGWAIGGPIMGYVSDHLNNRRMPLWLGSLLGSLTIGAIIYVEGISMLSMGILLFLFGVFSSTQNIAFAIAKESTMPTLAGSAIALTNMFVMLMGSFLQPLVGKILDINWDGTFVNNIHHYSNSNYQYALMVIPITYAVSFALSLFLKKSYSHVEAPAVGTVKHVEELSVEQLLQKT